MIRHSNFNYEFYFCLVDGQVGECYFKNRNIKIFNVLTYTTKINIIYIAYLQNIDVEPAQAKTLAH